MKISHLHLVAASRDLQLAYENETDSKRRAVIRDLGVAVAKLIGPDPERKGKKEIVLS